RQNKAPVVNSINLYATGSGSTSMTPQASGYHVDVNVTDQNKLSDLNTIKVTIFYDADGSVNWPGDVPTSANTQTTVILTWANGSGFSINAGSPTTWTIGTCSAPSLSGKTGTFQFDFTVGKVAKETTGSAKWFIYAIATDKSSATGDNHYPSSGGITMNWYGELTLSSSGTIDWSSVEPGTDFGDTTKQTGIGATYIANGDYDEKVSSTAYWYDSSASTTLSSSASSGQKNVTVSSASGFEVGQTVLISDNTNSEIKVIDSINGNILTMTENLTNTYASGSSVKHVAILDASGSCASTNNFALKADDTATLASAVLITTGGVLIDDTGTITSETGDTVNTNTLWLKLADEFDKATYSGTIYFTIVNG
ncbi:MAG: hypothetical protein N3E40_04860, partial [Dehalococcoidia bacterium]|nr:hypothetical protein [Dehalococcoidia bacterium]